MTIPHCLAWTYSEVCSFLTCYGDTGCSQQVVVGLLNHY